MEIQVIPCCNPLVENASSRIAVLLEQMFEREPERIATIRVGFYGDGAPIQPGLHMIHFQAGLTDGRLVRADGFIGDLRDIFGDRLLKESLARLKEEVSGGRLHG